MELATRRQILCLGTGETLSQPEPASDAKKPDRGGWAPTYLHNVSHTPTLWIGRELAHGQMVAQGSFMNE